MPETNELTVHARQSFIDGRWSDHGGRPLAILNPATEEVLAEVVQGTALEARRALEAAERAMVGWKQKTAYERARPLKRLAEGLREDVEAFAR
ncbi:MAG: aldehyde dehydrogenase family protein, partial [Verrucomicrobiota bacterium]